MSGTYGSKRLVVGAHYGLRDWLVQRSTGVLMAVFTLVVFGRLLLTEGPIDYAVWAGLFSGVCMKSLTFMIVMSLAWHAWVGARDIWMDYIKPVSLRLLADVLTIAWLVACIGMALRVLWRI